MKVVKTKEEIIKDTAKQVKNTISNVREIYNVLENVIFETLKTVNEDQDVCIRLFEGINLEGNFIAEKTKKNNLTGEMHLVESKIKPKFNITRYYCEKLNNK